MIAWLQDYGLAIDIAICLLLVTTIGYAVALNRKLNVLRAAANIELPASRLDDGCVE